jgi:hypothetical protein
LNADTLASAKPLGDVARVRAVFPVTVAVNFELPAAMVTRQPIDGLPLHEMKMPVPPFLTTGIRAKAPLFLPGICSTFLPQHSQAESGFMGASVSCFDIVDLGQKDFVVSNMTAFLKGTYNELTLYMDLWNDKLIAHALSSRRGDRRIQEAVSGSTTDPAQ